MILILSTTRIEGLEGTYATPNLIGPADLNHADIVYTDNERVIDLAKKFNVEVRDFPKHPPTVKEGTPPQSPQSPKNEEKEEVGASEPENVLTPLDIPETKVVTGPEDMDDETLRAYAIGQGITRANSMKRDTIIAKLNKNK